MLRRHVAAPDNTAVRTALWRALHLEVDSRPHVFEDEIGLKLAAPGVSMYLTKNAIVTTLRQVAALASDSTLVMSFMLPIELLDAEVRPGVERAAEGARASGTRYRVQRRSTVSATMLAQRYFAGRTDGLRPPSNSEELLVATS